MEAVVSLVTGGGGRGAQPPISLAARFLLLPRGGGEGRGRGGPPRSPCLTSRHVQHSVSYTLS